MSYAHHNHYKWVESGTKLVCSPLGRKVANLLGYAGRGIYNCPIKHEKVNWSDDRMVSVVWRHDLCNFDGEGLSRLWILCHRWMLRVEIEGIGPGYLRLKFFQRSHRDGMIHERLPDCEEMIARVDADWEGQVAE